MQKYEFEIIEHFGEFSSKDVKEMLNELGEKGFCVVASTSDELGIGAVILQRPKQ